MCAYEYTLKECVYQIVPYEGPWPSVIKLFQYIQLSYKERNFLLDTHAHTHKFSHLQREGDKRTCTGSKC
jgi:hypothetical protein